MQETIVDTEERASDIRIGFSLQNERDLSIIANMNGISSISEFEDIQMDNGTTAGTIQSGTPGITPIWDAGIHGENQIIGIMDILVDINHCFFRDNIDNTVRPSHRKVVGYRVDPPRPIPSDIHATFADWNCFRR